MNFVKPDVKNSPSCPHFPKCGGCDFLDLNQETYRNKKKEIFSTLIDEDSLKITPDWIWISPHSRRKIILQINKQNLLGFHSKKTNQLVEIESCFAAEKEISNLIPELKKFAKSFPHNIISQISITLFDNGLDLIFFLKKEPDFLQNQKLISFAQKNNLNISYSYQRSLTPILLSKKNKVSYEDFGINLDSNIFIQATKSGLEEIIKIIRNEITEGSVIADLYSGFGAYSFAISDKARQVFSFEGDEKMTKMISENARENNLQNKIFTSAQDLFSNPLTTKELKKFDIAIINPPRNGASPQISEISKSNLKKLIYVSCNPQSFWRDAKILLAENFIISKLSVLDQFYATKHLELIAIFEKND